MAGINKDLKVSGGPKIAVKQVGYAKVAQSAILAKPEYTGADRKAPAKAIPNVDRVKGDPVKAAMDRIANPPEPREQMRGQQTSKHYKEDGRAFKSNMFATGEETGG